MMKKILKTSIGIGFAILLVLMAVHIALADNGPHGGFNTPTTDSCAGCHRAHTSTASKLLMTSTSNLCESCHGPAGTGADTNVWDGVYLSRDATTNDAEGTVNWGLKSGGFVNTVMNTSFATGATTRPATSAHTFDGNPAMIWGNGGNGSGAGKSMALDCGSCHNPHGNAGPNGTATYRILRPIPQGSGAGSGVVVADVSAHTYTIDDATGDYWEQNYGTTENVLSSWCAQCHTRYMAGDNAESNASGDPIFAFRHRSNGADGVTCTDCHVAHGTSAAMGVNSGAVSWPDGSASPNGNQRSSLLRLDNRGVCVQCHTNP